MKTPFKTALLILALALGLTTEPPSAAKAENAPLQQTGLINVLRITLENQPDIKLAGMDVDDADGNLQAAGGQFDATLFGNLFYQKNDSILTEYEQNLLGYEAEKDETVGLEAGVQKTFRNGYQGKASVKTAREDDQSGLEGYPTITRNVIEFSVTIPLSQGKGEAITAEERENQLRMKAARQQRQKIISDAIAAGANAYWDYLEAHRYLGIKEEMEARTLAFLAKTNRMVELGELAATDSTQLKAQLATLRGERIEAERSLYEAKQRLGMSMGIPFSQIDDLGEPLDAFPGLGETDCALLPAPARLAEQALDKRGDYQAAKLEEEILEVQLEKDADNLKPRLDLELSANFEGIGEDNSTLDPAVEETTGPGGMIMLKGEWPVANNSSRGRMLANQARQRQARLRTLELERSIHSNIAVSVMDVQRLAKAAINLDEAVQLYNTAIEDEISRLKLGLSTLTNAITIEDKSNTAQEDLIIQQSALAKAIVKLRNETGTLLKMDNETGMVDLEAITTLPVIEP